MTTARAQAVLDAARSFTAMEKMIAEWSEIDTSTPSELDVNAVEAARMTHGELIERATAASSALRMLNVTRNDPSAKAKRKKMATHVTVVLTFTGLARERDHVSSDVDNVLDSGTFQDAVTEYAADQGHDYELHSAVLTTVREEPLP